MRVPQSPPDWRSSFFSNPNPEQMSRLVKILSSPEIAELVKYANYNCMHWHKLRYQPMPEGITPVEVWAAISMIRSSQLQELKISFVEDNLKFWVPSRHQELLHRIDQDAGGFIGSRARGRPSDSGDRFLFNSLMEEAIASSQLEGATTTREVAKKMLRTRRRPRDHSEQMILNNYQAILEIREMKNDPLTPGMLCHIQEVLTKDTLRDPKSAGRFRTAEDNVCVVGGATDEMLHKPPSAISLARRIDEVCDFANSRPDTFIHPVIRAVALHFAIGFIHPFVDGNGRTARAVFYWFMLKKGYWVFEYLPISRILRNAPGQYARAYLYTETDNGDLTYFNHYNLRVIDRAVREMHEYFADKEQTMTEARQLVDGNKDLNHRQIAIAYEAIQNPDATFTINQHAGTYNIALATARSDLFGLERNNILKSKKDGKKWSFSVAPSFRKTCGGKKAFRKYRQLSATSKLR